MVKNQAVMVTIGATIFTDIAALLVLAICVSIHSGDFSAASLVMQLVSLGFYAIIILFGFYWLGKEYFRRTGDEESNQFLFVLLAVFLASIGAQLINVDKIIGAFLAGLAVNDVVIYRYTWAESFTMWSLSLPQVAATLAAALVAYQVKDADGQTLINEAVFNSVIVLMLITSILGPVLTAQFATKLPLPKTREDEENRNIESTLDEWLPQLKNEIKNDHFTVLIPIYNPYTQRDLIEMGALLAKKESGIIVPVSIAAAHVHMDDPQVDGNLKQSQILLDRAIEISQEFEVSAQPIIRIDDDAAQGISRSAKEKNANLIIMGWSENTGLKARLFGTILDTVFWSSHCPVAVMRLLDHPVNLRRILVPIKNLSQATLETNKFAQLLADSNQGIITLLHICDRQTPQEQITEFKTTLSKLITEYELSKECKIKMIIHDSPSQVIIRASHQFDLVVLRSFRRRTAGGLAVSDITTEVLKKLSCSLVLFGQPHS